MDHSVGLKTGKMHFINFPEAVRPSPASMWWNLALVRPRPPAPRPPARPSLRSVSPDESLFLSLPYRARSLVPVFSYLANAEEIPYIFRVVRDRRQNLASSIWKNKWGHGDDLLRLIRPR